MFYVSIYTIPAVESNLSQMSGAKRIGCSLVRERVGKGVIASERLKPFRDVWQKERKGFVSM